MENVRNRIIKAMATLDDCKVGSTLFVVDIGSLREVKVTCLENKEGLVYFFTADVIRTYSASYDSGYEFAVKDLQQSKDSKTFVRGLTTRHALGDLGIEPSRYDDRPTQLFTDLLAAKHVYLQWVNLQGLVPNANFLYADADGISVVTNPFKPNNHFQDF